MKKVDIIMSAMQMNVHYIHISYVRVTAIEVVRATELHEEARATINPRKGNFLKKIAK